MLIRNDGTILLETKYYFCNIIITPLREKIKQIIIVLLVILHLSRIFFS